MGLSTQSDHKTKLLDQVRGMLRAKHYSIRTEQAYLDWIKKYILFHKKRHPAEMREKEIGEFLSHLAVNKNVAASTQNQALCAIVFLYKYILNKDIGELNLVWAKKPQKLPEVFTQAEVEKVLSQLNGVYWLLGILIYGAGLRLIECLRLRIHDFDFTNKKITVRAGKGEKDRVAMLPEIVIPALQKHLKSVKSQHDQDLKEGYGTVFMPYALAKKYRTANQEWGWQYVFPASRLSIDPRSGVKQRHHLDETAVQKAVRAAIKKAGIHKHASCHTLRHSFAMHWLQNGGTLEGLSHHLAHSSQQTTEIYGEILDERAEEEYEKFAPDIDF